jgi:hypothetical protein
MPSIDNIKHKRLESLDEKKRMKRKKNSGGKEE